MPTIETIDQWLLENPLRKWRKDSQFRVSRIAQILGVSLTAIQKWEGGHTTPNEVNMKSLAALTAQPDFQEQWNKWQASAEWLRK
jgi:DNA-binding transcriptional regulator YiaG